VVDSVDRLRLKDCVAELASLLQEEVSKRTLVCLQRKCTGEITAVVGVERTAPHFQR
jgi:hypothetical protein